MDVIRSIGTMLGPMGGVVFGPAMGVVCVAGAVRIRRAWPVLAAGALGLVLALSTWLHFWVLTPGLSPPWRVIAESVNVAVGAAAGLALLVTALFAVAAEPVESSAEGRRAWGRAVLVLVALAVIGYVAYGAGMSHFHEVNCGAGFDGDCDLGFLEGLLWAAIAMAATAFMGAVLELAIRRIRK